MVNDKINVAAIKQLYEAVTSGDNDKLNDLIGESNDPRSSFVKEAKEATAAEQKEARAGSVSDETARRVAAVEEEFTSVMNKVEGMKEDLVRELKEMLEDSTKGFVSTKSFNERLESLPNTVKEQARRAFAEIQQKDVESGMIQSNKSFRALLDEKLGRYNRTANGELTGFTSESLISDCKSFDELASQLRQYNDITYGQKSTFTTSANTPQAYRGPAQFEQGERRVWITDLVPSVPNHHSNTYEWEVYDLETPADLGPPAHDGGVYVAAGPVAEGAVSNTIKLADPVIQTSSMIEFASTLAVSKRSLKTVSTLSTEIPLKMLEAARRSYEQEMLFGSGVAPDHFSGIFTTLSDAKYDANRTYLDTVDPDATILDLLLYGMKELHERDEGAAPTGTEVMTCLMSPADWYALRSLKNAAGTNDRRYIISPENPAHGRDGILGLQIVMTPAMTGATIQNIADTASVPAMLLGMFSVGARRFEGEAWEMIIDGAGSENVTKRQYIYQVNGNYGFGLTHPQAFQRLANGNGA